MMQAIEPTAKHDAPAGRPQPIAFHDGTLWLGCWDTAKLYAIDPATWTVQAEVALPDKAYGIASFEGSLRVVIGIGEEDDRYIYRYEPGKPFGEEGRMPCPEFTGSHLTTDGKALYLAQQTHRRMVELDANAGVERTIPFPVRSAGIGFENGTFYMIAADDEFDVLELATFDIDTEGARPAVVAPMHVEARGLTSDGNSWWTSYREENAVVNFSTPL